MAVATKVASSVTETPRPSANWHLVLARDGTVLAATDAASASWVGMPLAECPDAPEDVKQAARTLLGMAYESPPPLMMDVPLESVQKVLHVTVVEAVPIRRKPTDLRALLHSSLEALGRQAKDRDVTLNVVVDDGLPPFVSLDADKVGWVMSALVGNALRYVRSGSRFMPGGSIVVRATYHATVPEVALEVQDDGPGIADDKVPILFTAGPDRARVGLGLVMVRDIVAAHAGHLEVDSDATAFGPGTSIRLTLPVW